MTPIVRDTHFREVANVRVDSKRRIGIPKAINPDSVDSYRLYTNDAGQIILDPQITMPAAEAWLYKNQEALQALHQGFKDLKAGKLIKRGSFSKYAEEY